MIDRIYVSDATLNTIERYGQNNLTNVSGKPDEHLCVEFVRAKDAAAPAMVHIGWQVRHTRAPVPRWQDAQQCEYDRSKDAPGLEWRKVYADAPLAALDASATVIPVSPEELAKLQAQPDARAAADAISLAKAILHLVDDFHERPTSENRTVLRIALTEEFGKLLEARAAAPQAALTDEQIETIHYAATWLSRSEDIGNRKHAGRLLTILATAPTERMSDAARDAEDAARLDWLDKNMWHREKNLWDAKTWAGHAMWVTFAPDGIQGSARRIIDAARKAEIERSGGEA
ncbi:hypothetical protein [Paraburkholderia tropica]|uniref:hypothetical protein n=1 Tax=Paraburkholderia tropica TaxID=92647 RepID=UPI001F2AD2FD|nr:hypothetical protein [Paraburkholderia tropica]